MDTRERWRIDPERSTLTFNLRHAVLPDLRGHFDCWGGSVCIDRAHPEGSSVRLWVDLSSIETGSPRRDAYILATELFDLQWEPAVVFDSDRVELTDANHGIVVGKLGVHTFRREVAVTVERRPPHRAPNGAARLVYDARAAVERAAFGLQRKRHLGDWLAEQLLDKSIEIAAHVEMVREDVAARSVGGLAAVASSRRAGSARPN